MSRRVALVLVLLGLVLRPAAEAGESLDELLSAFQVTPLGEQAPAPFLLESLDGRPVALADVLGRAVMLYFWDST